MIDPAAVEVAEVVIVAALPAGIVPPGSATNIHEQDGPCANHDEGLQERINASVGRSVVRPRSWKIALNTIPQLRAAFGDPANLPTAELLAACGLRFNRFHATALCRAHPVDTRTPGPSHDAAPR